MSGTPELPHPDVGPENGPPQWSSGLGPASWQPQTPAHCLAHRTPPRAGAAGGPPQWSSSPGPASWQPRTPAHRVARSPCPEYPYSPDQVLVPRTGYGYLRIPASSGKWGQCPSPSSRYPFPVPLPGQDRAGQQTETGHPPWGCRPLSPGSLQAPGRGLIELIPVPLNLNGAAMHKRGTFALCPNGESLGPVPYSSDDSLPSSAESSLELPLAEPLRGSPCGGARGQHVWQ